MDNLQNHYLLSGHFKNTKIDKMSKYGSLYIYIYIYIYISACTYIIQLPNNLALIVQIIKLLF